MFRIIAVALLLGITASLSTLFMTAGQPGTFVAPTFPSTTIMHASNDPGNNGQASDEWPMFGGAPDHARAVQTAPAFGIGPTWSHSVGNFTYGVRTFTSSPAIVGGRVYVGSDQGHVYSLDAATGAQVWSFETRGMVESSPAVVDGLVFVGCNDDNVYCLNATTGKLVWSYITGDSVLSSPAVAGGLLYVGSGYHLFCLNARTSALVWTFLTRDYVDSSPAVAANRVYVTSVDGILYCLNATSGASIWNCTTGGYYPSPAVSDGKVYTCGNKIYCLNATTGKSIWNFTWDSINFDISMFSLAVAGGRVYAGIDKLYCLNSTTGTLIWSSTTGDYIESSPALASGRVFVKGRAQTTDKMYCIDASSGTLVWSYFLDGILGSSIAFAGGYVYTVDNDETLQRLPMDLVPSLPFVIISVSLGINCIAAIVIVISKKREKSEPLGQDSKHILLGSILIETGAFLIAFFYFLSEIIPYINMFLTLALGCFFFMWGARFIIAGVLERRGWKVGRGVFDFKRPAPT